jgi:PPP family 3-phenylpropionic acid transporter
MTEGGTRSFAVRVALFYGALFIVYGMHVPFFPVWLDWRGLSAGEISIVMALPFFLRLVVTPVGALYADRHAAHRRLLIRLGWISLAIVLALSQVTGFFPILLLAVPLIICNSTIMPLIETIAVAGMRLRGLDYGRMRLWGSLTFIAASFAGGIAVSHFGGGAGIWLIAIGCAATAVAAHLLPTGKLHVAQHASATPFWQVAEPLGLLRHPVFYTFLIAAGCVQAAHGTFLTFGTLIWQKQGLSGTWIGTLWAIGVLAEVAIFAISGRIVRYVGAARLLMIGAVCSIARWLIMGFHPSLEVLIPIQLLHGITYGGSHIGAIHFIHDAIPRHISGSAQALYATMASGLAMGVAMLVAGALFSAGGEAAYFAMVLIALISLLAALRLTQIWDGSELNIANAAADPAAVPVSPTGPDPTVR